MTSSTVTILLWIAALSSGLIAGIYFAFSIFIMKAFGKISSIHAIAAMNSINQTILRSLFMPLFFGSTIISLLLVTFAFTYWGEKGSELMLAAGTIYFIGMFVCTALFNVPLNNSLAKIDPSNANADTHWNYYLKTWTNWNHLRTVSSLVTCIFCIWNLTGH